MKARCLLHTDTPGVDIGAVLGQEGDEGMDRPVAYFREGLNLQKPVTLPPNCLAVVDKIKTF